MRKGDLSSRPVCGVCGGEILHSFLSNHDVEVERAYSRRHRVKMRTFYCSLDCLGIASEAPAGGRRNASGPLNPGQRPLFDSQSDEEDVAHVRASPAPDRAFWPNSVLPRPGPSRGRAGGAR